MRALKLYSWFVMLAMLVATIWCSVESNVIQGFVEVGSTRWGIATLMDAYFAFLTFLIWVWSREKGWGARALWAVLVLGLGNMGMCAYLLTRVIPARPSHA